MKGLISIDKAHEWILKNMPNYVKQIDYLTVNINNEDMANDFRKAMGTENTTQEQINTIVHDSCVLFCKHCGCGIPRETCTSLGTCNEHDEFRTAIRAHLMENKKEYSYERTDETIGAKVDKNNYHKRYIGKHVVAGGNLNGTKGYVIDAKIEDEEFFGETLYLYIKNEFDGTIDKYCKDDVQEIIYTEGYRDLE